MDPHGGLAIRELADRTRSRSHTHAIQVVFDTASESEISRGFSVVFQEPGAYIGHEFV